MVLIEQQALALIKTRTNALKENKRIELNGGIVDKLILAFCDSPYSRILEKIPTKILCTNLLTYSMI